MLLGYLELEINLLLKRKNVKKGVEQIGLQNDDNYHSQTGLTLNPVPSLVDRRKNMLFYRLSPRLLKNAFRYRDTASR